MSRPVVLVADDDEDILDLLRLRLDRAGYDVLLAHDGHEALAVAEAQPIDVAVIDVMMPGLDGHEVVRRLRARPETAGIPIVVLTAAAQERVAQDSAEAGADAHMRKPFSPRELVARLEELRS